MRIYANASLARLHDLCCFGFRHFEVDALILCAEAGHDALESGLRSPIASRRASGRCRRCRRPSSTAPRASPCWRWAGRAASVSSCKSPSLIGVLDFDLWVADEIALANIYSSDEATLVEEGASSPRWRRRCPHSRACHRDRSRLEVQRRPSDGGWVGARPIRAARGSAEGIGFREDR
jgi:hypothetical protein